MLTVKEAPVLSLDFTTNMKQLLNLIKQTKTYVFTQEKNTKKRHTRDQNEEKIMEKKSRTKGKLKDKKGREYEKK